MSEPSTFFAGFADTRLDLPRGSIRLRFGGAGEPVLLLHGNPQTHAMWHKVAPSLAAFASVVAPDLPGYGGSFHPDPVADPASCSRRAIAATMADVMSAIGHERFAVVGHDRGGLIGARLALDFPERVTRLALLDVVPDLDHFERNDMSHALAFNYFTWFAQPHPKPEALVSKAPDSWFGGDDANPEIFSAEAVADYRAGLAQRDAAARMAREVNAGAPFDLAALREDHMLRRRLTCPVEVIWGRRGQIGGWYDPGALWSEHARQPVESHGIDAGHFLAEEAPGEIACLLADFLAAEQNRAATLPI